MLPIPVIAVFDIGKTNKKLFLFNEAYQVVFEKSCRLNEIVDEDGYPCEDVQGLTKLVHTLLHEVLNIETFLVKAVNFSTYGASFVHVDSAGEPIAPLYNYLKPFPTELKQQFYDIYGGEETFSNLTASPVLGNLNSGMQLYWLKYCRPNVYENIRYSLHLPQYLSYLISRQYYAEITSIGCHTNLWNFTTNSYHNWVYDEGIFDKFPPIIPGDHVMSTRYKSHSVEVGVGLHDSSAALIPYLVSFKEPFILISTGTWCISLNPFNNQPLTTAELNCDCLCYLTFKGEPVKASRLFAGNEHELQVQRIADHFHQQPSRYHAMTYNPKIIEALHSEPRNSSNPQTRLLNSSSTFSQKPLSQFATDEEAYHALVADIVTQQRASTQLVLSPQVSQIFVDGGFSHNEVYMRLLAAAFPGKKVYAASLAQATAIGTALAIHQHWNKMPAPRELIELKLYPAH